MGKHSVLWLALMVTLGCGTLANAQDGLYTPPKIMEPKTPKSVYLRNGDTHNLPCTASGTPNPKYTWRYKGGNPLQDMAMPRTVTFDETTGTLTVMDFTDREEGEYQCLAFNEIRPGKRITVQTPAYSVRMVGLESWSNVNPQSLVRTSGEAATLTCENPPRSQPPGAFKWFISQKQFGDSSGSEFRTTSRTYIDNKGNLHFSYVISDDAKFYKCALSNSEDNTIKLTTGAWELEVVQGLDAETAPGALYYTADATAFRNEATELECVFSGSPIPTVAWFDNTDAPITSTEKYRLSDYNRKLTISRVVEEDKGIYTCRGSSTMGSKEQKIDLKVVSKPIPVQVLDDVISPEHFDVVLHCKTRPVEGGAPIGPPVWTMNGEPFTADGSKTRYNTDQTELIIMKVKKPDDIACYRCEASNQYGTLYADGCLNVINPIQMVQVPPLNQTIKKGDTIDLTVTAKTDVMQRDNLRTRALFRGGVYEYSRNQFPPFMTYDPSTKTASINTSSLTDEEFRKVNGTYTLEVYHSYEKKSVEVVVQLEEIPVIIIIPPVTEAPVVAASVSLWWIAIIVAVLVLILIIVIIVYCCYRRNQQGVYPLGKVEEAHHLDPKKDLENNGFHDLSRAGDDNPTNRPPPASMLDDYPVSDDDASLGEYGDLDTGKFNEDGSFIGIYGTNKPEKQPLIGESTI